MPTADVTRVIEDAIPGRLVLRLTYRALDGTEIAPLVEPLAIRFNPARHRVLWCFNRDAGHIEQPLWDGISGAVTTGEVFAPRPWAEEGASGAPSN